MRFLKRKVNLKVDFINEDNDLSEIPDIKSDLSMNKSHSLETNSSSSASTIKEYLLPTRKPRQKPTNPNGSSKNIVKNYGKALCSFASSHIATPYIQNIIMKNSWNTIEVHKFMAYSKSKKEDVNNIESLRKLLVLGEEESDEMYIYKKIFKELSVIFLKYFSVNWIFGGRLQHKKAHLDFRFKMLRRIQNPEKFTYLKTFTKS